MEEEADDLYADFGSPVGLGGDGRKVRFELKPCNLCLA